MGLKIFILISKFQKKICQSCPIQILKSYLEKTDSATLVSYFDLIEFQGFANHLPGDWLSATFSHLVMSNSFPAEHAE